MGYYDLDNSSSDDLLGILAALSQNNNSSNPAFTPEPLGPQIQNKIARPIDPKKLVSNQLQSAKQNNPYALSPDYFQKLLHQEEQRYADSNENYDQSIAKLNNLRETMLKAAEPQLDLSGVLALARNLGTQGNTIGQGYRAPETLDKTLGNLAGLDEAIQKVQKEKNSLSKPGEDLIKTLAVQGAKNEGRVNINNYLSDKNDIMRERNDIARRNLEMRGTNFANTVVDKDKLVTIYDQRLAGGLRVLDLINDAEAAKGNPQGLQTNEPYLAALNAEIARLETGAQSPGLHAAEKTEMRLLKSKLNDIRGFIMGDQKGVDMTPQITQARNLVNSLGKSTLDAMEKRIDLLTSGSLDSQKPIFEAKKETALGNYKGHFEENKKVSPNYKGVNRVIQNGVTFVWSPEKDTYVQEGK